MNASVNNQLLDMNYKIVDVNDTYRNMYRVGNE